MFSLINLIYVRYLTTEKLMGVPSIYFNKTLSQGKREEASHYHALEFMVPKARPIWCSLPPALLRS